MSFFGGGDSNRLRSCASQDLTSSFAEDRDKSRDFTQASAAVVLVPKISMLKCTKTRKKWNLFGVFKKCLKEFQAHVKKKHVLLWFSCRSKLLKKPHAFCETPLPSYPPRNVVVHCCQASAGPMAWAKLHLQPWESKGIPQCYPTQEIASLIKGLLTIGIPLLEGLRIEIGPY